MAGPQVIAAAADGLSWIRVTFDSDMVGGDLTNPAAWANDPVFAGADPAIVAVYYAARVASLQLASNMTPDRVYVVTAPGTITDGGGIPIDPAFKSKDYVTPQTTELESGDPWAVSSTGDFIDVGQPPFDLVAWSASDPGVDLPHLIALSLLSDSRAPSDADLPDAAGDPPYRGGYWGDTLSPTPGDSFGSLLWYYRRRGLTTDTVDQIRDAAVNACQWLLDDGIAARVEVSAERLGTDGIALSVLAAKADGTTAAVRFPDLWKAWG